MIEQVIRDIQEAKEYLESLRTEFSSQPELLEFYEPTALEIVRHHELRLSELLQQATGTDFISRPTEQEIDVWVRLEGEQFHEGKGPVGIVGAFLQKLNTASQHVVSLIDDGIKRANLPFFDLSQTAPGSLKLGLKKPDINDFTADQSLFEVDPWDKLKEMKNEQEKAVQGFQLLVKAISAVSDDNIDEIRNELPNENSVIKLLHFAKELAPSTRSPIERISFEGKDIGIPKRIVSADKQTRKLLMESAKKLKQDSEYVEGKAVIREQDIDYLTLTARPLVIGEKQFNEIKCKFANNVTADDIDNYLNRLVNISGFLIYGTNNQPLRLEIDEIAIDEDDQD